MGGKEEKVSLWQVCLSRNAWPILKPLMALAQIPGLDVALKFLFCYQLYTIQRSQGWEARCLLGKASVPRLRSRAETALIVKLPGIWRGHRLCVEGKEMVYKCPAEVLGVRTRTWLFLRSLEFIFNWGVALTSSIDGTGSLLGLKGCEYSEMWSWTFGG